MKLGLGTAGAFGMAHRLVDKKIVEHAGYVAAGTAVGQLSILIATPYLARRYSPFEFGELAIAVSVCSVAYAIGCLKYDWALSTSDDSAAPKLRSICFFLALAVAGFAGLASCLPLARWGVPASFRLLAKPQITLPLVFLAITYQAAASSFMQRAEFGSLGVLRASQGLIFVFAAIFLPVGLVGSQLLSQIGGALLIIQIVSKPTSIRDSWQSAVRLRRFPLYYLFGSASDVLGYSVGIFVLSGAYGLDRTGQFAQVQRLIGAPMLLISASLSQVLLKHTADEVRARRPLEGLVKKLGGTLVALSAAALAVLSIAGETIFRAILGSQWQVNTRLIVCVSLIVMARTCVSPLSSILIAADQHRKLVGWQFGYLLSSLTVLSVLAARVGYWTFLWCYAVHEFVLYGIYLGLIVNASRKTGNTACAAYSE